MSNRPIARVNTITYQFFMDRLRICGIYKSIQIYMYYFIDASKWPLNVNVFRLKILHFSLFRKHT